MNPWDGDYAYVRWFEPDRKKIKKMKIGLWIAKGLIWDFLFSQSVGNLQRTR